MARSRSKKSLPVFSRNRLIAAAVILLLIGGLAYMQFKPDSSDNASAPNGSAQPHVDLSPPTPSEKQETEDHKKDLASQPTPSPASSSNKKQVTPVITSADRKEARAYVPGIFEDGGTCTATFTNGADKVKATSEGFENVSYTTCAPMTLSGPLNLKGTWTVVVSYSSASAEGKSAPFEVH